MGMNETWPDIYDEGGTDITSNLDHSQNSEAAVEAPSLKISSHETYLKWPQRPFQSAWE